MARGKTLPYAYRDPDTNDIIRVMDLNKDQAKEGRKFFSKFSRCMVDCKAPKQHKHS